MLTAKSIEILHISISVRAEVVSKGIPSSCRRGIDLRSSASIEKHSVCSNAHELIVVSYASSRRKTSLDQLSVAVKEGGDIFLDLLQTACVPKWREARQATSSARQSFMKKNQKIS